MANSYRLYLLGGFRLEREGARVQLYSRKVESLLAYLVLFPQEHAREKLAALLWGDSTDEQARHSLRMGLSSIRKHLSNDALLADRETVQWNPKFALWVDARDLMTDAGIAGDSRRRTTNEGVSGLLSAVALYRGDLLPDFYDDWLTPLRDEYRDLYIHALLQLVQQHRAQGEYAQAIEWAQKVLNSDAANEAAHQHLIVCYSALGNRTAALDQYDACQTALRDELGVPPAPETRALYEKILAQTDTQSPAARLTNLPRPTTSFVGREREIEEIRGLLTADDGQRTTSLPITRHSSP